MDKSLVTYKLSKLTQKVKSLCRSVTSEELKSIIKTTLRKSNVIFYSSGRRGE